MPSIGISQCCLVCGVSRWILRSHHIGTIAAGGPAGAAPQVPLNQFSVGRNLTQPLPRDKCHDSTMIHLSNHKRRYVPRPVAPIFRR